MFTPITKFGFPPRTVIRELSDTRHSEFNSLFNLAQCSLLIRQALLYSLYCQTYEYVQVANPDVLKSGTNENLKKVGSTFRVESDIAGLINRGGWRKGALGLRPGRSQHREVSGLGFWTFSPVRLENLKASHRG